MKKLIIFVVLFTVVKVNAQSVFSGQVIDSLSLQPLTGASVILNYAGKEGGVKTDNNGKFYLDLPMAENRISIRYTGYVTKWYYLKKGESLQNITVGLEEVSKQLEQVIVTSKGFDKNVRKPSLGVSSLNIKTLENLPSAFGEIDLFRSLQMLPGVTSVGEASNGVNIRGGTTDQTLILMDGAPIFNPTHMFGLFSVTPPEAVRNVDLYKGNVPARFGGRAASVLDVSLQNPDASKIKLNAGISPISERLMINVPLVKDKLAVYVAGRGSFNDFILPKLDESLETTKARFGEVVSKLSWRLSQKSNLTAMHYYSSDYFQTDLLTSLPNVVGTTTYFEHKTANVALQYTYFINSKWDLQLSAHNADYRPTIATRESANNNDVKLKSGVRQRQAGGSANYQTDKQKVEFGLNYLSYVIDPGTLDPGISESVNALNINQEYAREIALHIDDELNINQKLALSLGLRYSYFSQLGPANVRSYLPGEPRDDFSVTEEQEVAKNKTIQNYGGLEPRFGLRYALDAQSSVKLGYNLMRQYLQIVSNTTTPIPTSRWKTSDTHIRPQISQLFTAGYYRSFDSDIYEVTGELYYRSTNNILDYKPGADFLLQEFPETQLVQGISKAYGLETMLSKKKGTLTGWLNYTYARTLNRVDANLPLTEQINSGNWYAANFDKPHSFNSSIDIHVDEHNSFNFNFVYSTGRPYTEPVGFVRYQNNYLPFYDQRNNKRIPDYHRLDFAWNIYNPHKKARKYDTHWAFSVYNLYGRRNVYSIFFKSENNLTKAYRLHIFAVPIVSLSYNIKLN